MKKTMNTFAKKATVSALALTVALGSAYSIHAATEHFNDAAATADSKAWTQWKSDWSTISDDYEEVSIEVGKSESEIGFAFYTHTSDTPKVRICKVKAGLSKATAFEGSLTATTVAYSESLKTELESAGESSDGTYNSAKVTVTGLKENTKYYYQVYQNGAWGDIKTYTTKDFDEYSVLYVGDPQIGACSGQTDSESTALSGLYAARNDSYNWNEILTETLSNNSNLSFIISAGDQVNKATNEYEYSGFLYPEALSGIALAPTIGNHDSSNVSYTNHYNIPNSFDVDDTEQEAYTTGHTAAGTDYYYTYGDVLYIVLDTNNYNCATHENVIKKAVSENPDTKWRIVTFHQDIYGSGADHSDSDGIVLRTQLTPLMDKYDIDIVLQGHDHTYSRSYQISSDGQSHTAYSSTLSRSATDEEKAEYETQNNCYNLCSSAADGNTIINPEGTVYFEQNSATGSKFYNLIANQQNYIAERSQTWTPTYSVMDVKEDSITMTTYDATTGEILEGSASYTIVKKADLADQTVQLAKTQYTYTGKACTPKVTISGLTEGKDFTVAYTNNTEVGTATVTITGKGDYVGTVTKNFTIKLGSVSAKATTAKGKINVKITALTGASGYEIYTSKDGKKYSKASTVKAFKSSKTVAIKGTKKKTYYVKVRAYRTVNGKKVYTGYTKVMKIKVK